MNRSVGRWALLLGALLFAVLGQLYFARRPEYFWDAVLFYAIAAVCLWAVSRPAAADAAIGARSARGLPRDWPRAALIAVSLGLTAVAMLQLLRPHATYWPIFWTWVGGMALCLAATLPTPMRFSSSTLAAQKRIGWWEVGVIALIVGGAFLLRAWRIDSIPWTLSGDEGNFGRWAREALDGRLTNMFSTGHLSMPSMYAFFQAGWLRIAGDNIFGLRLPWAIMGAMSILGSYLLVRRLFGRGMAVLTAVLLAGYHYHIHYSRLGLNNIADPFFVSWALYFLVVGVQGKRRWAWALSGLLAGLAFYFYTGGRQVPVIILGVLAWAAIVEPGFIARHRSGLVVILIGFLVAVGPMALYAVQHPDDFNARINQVGIIQSGWLAREAANLGTSKLHILGEQFRKVFFAFNYTLDRTDFYKPPIPLFDFPASILFLLGVVLALSRLIDRPRGDAEPGAEGVRDQLPWRYAVFVIWFFGVIIAGGVLTDTAPSSQRILSSSVPAVFFVIVALYALVAAFGALLRMPKPVRFALALAVTVILTVGSVRFYFGRYQEGWTYGSFNGEVSTAIGYYMRDLGPEWKQYFMGAPRMWAEFGSATFISKNPYLDVVEPLTGLPTFVDPQFDSAFIVLPERAADLLWLQQAYPQGELEQVRRSGDGDGPLLFTAYIVHTKTSQGGSS